MPIEERPIVDAGGLDERGIGRVDVGHDDRITINRFAFLFCYLPLLQSTLHCKLISYSHYALIRFQVNIF